MDEQKTIADFLDVNTVMTRQLVRAKRRLIELLNEQKQTIIHEAVTRGLNPDVRLKPSGIDWLGDVPEHWEVKRLKQVCRLAYGDSLPDESRISETVPVYGSNGQVGSHNRANAEGPCLIIGRKGSFGKVNFSPISVFAIDTTLLH